MKNNIYVLLVILLILITLVIIFIKNRNLENYSKQIKNMSLTGVTNVTPVRSWNTNNMYLTACENECNKEGNNCKVFTTSADIINNRPGNCNLYNSSGIFGTPVYSGTDSIHFK
jgi:hypothetical protein